MMETKHPLLEDIFNQLAALSDETSRNKFLSHHRTLLSPSMVQQLDEAVGVFVRQDLQKAQRLAMAALTIAGKLGDKESRAYALRAQANASWFLGDNKQAVGLHAEAIRLFSDIGNRMEEGRTLSVSIQPLILLSEYDRALERAERARQIFTAAGESVRLARLSINVGNIFHRQDRFREALDYYERAYRELLPEKDAEGIIAALHNIALCLINLNDYVRALEAYDQARSFCQDRNMPLALAQADYNIASVYYSRGDYGKALAMLRTAREACEKAGDAYHAALCHLDLSEVYVELNMCPEALDMAEEAFSRFQQLGMGYESAKALCYSAIALGQQGRGPHALEYFDRARDMFAKEGNQVWPSLIDLYKAVVYFEEEKLLEARNYCQAALEFFRTSPVHAKAIVCQLLLARLSLKSEDIGTARRECDAALHDLENREAPNLRYQANFIMGQIEEASDHFEAAQNRYRAAKEILEGLRTGLREEELKISFMKNRSEVYENLVNLYLEHNTASGTSEEAWTYMEEAKSRALLDVISGNLIPVAVDDSYQSGTSQRVRDLRERLNWYYHRIQIEHLSQTLSSSERLLELQELAEQRERELQRVLREIPSAKAGAPGVEAAPISSLQEIRRSLGKEATLLEYFRVRDRILATVVTEGSLEIIPVTQVRRVARVLRMLQFQLSKFRLGSNYTRKFQKQIFQATRAHLAELHTELVAPVQHKFRGEHLVVIPHELLHYVPFHALFDGKQYLIDSFTVSYAPSASVYAQCCQKQVNMSGSALVIGVPDPQTPSILEELESVAAIFPESELFLGPDATGEVLRERGRHSRSIHIATHGSFRQDAPMFSGIRLGDTFLTLYDLYGLKLPVDQITLSGCSTGVSVIAAGDEVIGLVRGLLSAGARSLLLTMWDVNDSSTARFMKTFYTCLSQKRNRASALREAMFEVR
jgi:CHAT domain-containing protein